MEEDGDGDGDAFMLPYRMRARGVGQRYSLGGMSAQRRAGRGSA